MVGLRRLLLVVMVGLDPTIPGSVGTTIRDGILGTLTTPYEAP